MNTEITIHVTEEDIKNGIPGEASFCPIALAIKRDYPTAYVEVDGTYIVIDEKGKPDSNFFCEEAGEFVRAFDAEEIVRPQTFILHERDMEED